MRKFLFAASLGLLAVTLQEPSCAADLVGMAERVNDGDEFFACFSGSCFSIRLCGIDTPGKGELGYDDTVAALGKLVVNKQVRCRPVGEGSVCDGLTNRMSRGRQVAQCFVDEGKTDIAASLIERGLACDRKDRSGGHYSTDHPERVCP